VRRSRTLAVLALAASAASAQEKEIASRALGFGAFDVRGGTSALDSGRVASEAFEWTRSYVGFRAPEDWRTYTALVVRIENKGPRALSIRVEARDAESRDYWSRANLSFTVGPGENELRIPAALFAGEAQRPGRPLDRARMRSVIFAREAADDGLLLRFTDLRLVKEAGARDAGVHAWDFGPAGSALFAGFEAVTPDTRYATARGFGLVDAQLWQPYPDACRVRGPDSLSEDCVMIAKGGFRADLPRGRYKVSLGIDHPGPFWGEYPSFRRRVVRAQGKVVVDERDTPTAALARYFRSQELPPPRDDRELYDLYVATRQSEKVFEVQVGEGGLRLEFENEGCPIEPCFGLAVTHVIAARADDAKALDYLRSVSERRRREFATLTRLEIEAPTKTSTPFSVEGLERGKITQLAFSNENPVSELRLLSHVDLKKLRLEAGGWKGPGAGPKPRAGWAEPWLVRLSSDSTRVGMREKHVYWRAEGETRAGKPRTLLVEWVFPKGAKAGLYSGSLKILAGDRVLSEIPVELRLSARRLPEMDLPWGPFGHTVVEKWRTDLEDTPRARELERASLAKLRAAGLTQYSFSPRVVLDGAGEGLKVDAPEISAAMKTARAAGFLALVGYGQVFRDRDACSAELAPETWKQLFDSLETQSKRENWLPLTLVLCDEPEGEGLTALAKRRRAWPAQKGDERVKWSVTTHIEAAASAAHVDLARSSVEPFLADFEIGRLPPAWTYYNDLNRWSFGLRSFALRKHGLKGRIAWTWNQDAVDPFNPLDGREDDFHWCTGTREGELLCTLEWERAVVAGTGDYRRALLLSRLAAAEASRPAAAAARAFLVELEAKAGKKYAGVEEVSGLSRRLDALLSLFE
jgi:hypothetical protein